MRFSRTLAWIFGIGTPLVETIRRWSTWQEFPPAIIDDYLLGAWLTVRGDSEKEGTA